MRTDTSVRRGRRVDMIGQEWSGLTCCVCSSGHVDVRHGCGYTTLDHNRAQKAEAEAEAKEV